LRRLCVHLLPFVLVLALAVPARSASIEPLADRSPVDLVIDPEQQWLATANQTSSSVSLVRLADGKVLDEVAVGERPEAITLAPDRSTLLVGCSCAGTVELLKVAGNRLEHAGKITTGMHPHGIAVAPDGQRAYVAL